MTREEYLKLVQESAAFQDMDKEIQNKILTAEGTDMEAYSKIFVTERNDVIAAKKEFVTTTVKVVENFGQTAKVIVTVERKNAEEKNKKEEERASEKLLSEINNL